MLSTTDYDSPFGPLTLFASERGLCGVGFKDPNYSPADSVTEKVIVNPQAFPDGTIVYDNARFHSIVSELDSYFKGKLREFTLPIDFGTKGTPFQRSVWNALREIPYGTTITYGELAKKIGNVKAARAVGLANNRNPLAIVIPCHRVIGANGNLVGYAGGIAFKQALLALEGVPVKPTSSNSNRETVLQAGARCFAKHGFKATTIDEVADEAGMNKRMVYHYFGSKQGLYDKVLQRLYQMDRTKPSLNLDGEHIARLNLFSYLESTPNSQEAASRSLMRYERRIRQLQTQGELDGQIDAAILAQLNWLVDQFGSLLPGESTTNRSRDTLQRLLKTPLRTRSRVKPVVERRP